MSRDFEKLRRLVNEELSKLDEYRPNTFMLSRMEEKEKTDQDGDGDNDFDDVRIARRQASGMSKAAAIASVKKRPMGGKEKKRESASLSESIRSMTRNERRALHEAVKRRILKEEDAPAEPADSGEPDEVGGVDAAPPETPEPSAEASSKVIIKGTDKVAYIKREEKWYVNISLTLDQVLSFVKDVNKDSIRKQIENNAKIPTGAVFTIRSAFIIESKRDQMNSSTGFVFKKTVDGFVDPNPITNDEITEIVNDYKQLSFAPIEPAEASEQDKSGEMPIKKIGDYVRLQQIVQNQDSVFIRIKNEPNLAGFYELFSPDFIKKITSSLTADLNKITIPGNGKVNPKYRNLFNTLNPDNSSFVFSLGFKAPSPGPTMDAVVKDFNNLNGDNWYVCMFKHNAATNFQALPVPDGQ